MTVDMKQLAVGDTLPAIEFGPISRHTLALYCGGSGDLNPIHVDSDFAKASGYEDVFCLLYTSPSPRDQRGSRMPSSA